MGEPNSKYNNARKHLSYLLRQNEMFRVDSVEDIGASNDHQMIDALELLEKSYICIFLLDKSDEAPRYVLEKYGLWFDCYITKR